MSCDRDRAGGTEGYLADTGQSQRLALIKKGLMKAASDNVSSVRAWLLSHKPGMDAYGND